MNIHYTQLGTDYVPVGECTYHSLQITIKSLIKTNYRSGGGVWMRPAQPLSALMRRKYLMETVRRRSSKA